MSCLNAESFSFSCNPSNYAYPLQLDTHTYHPSFNKKRIALSQIDDSSPPKRFCKSMADVTNSINCTDPVSSSFFCNDLSSIFHRNKVVSCDTPESTGLARTGDLDDVLDRLFQDANAMAASTMLPDVEDMGLAVMVNVELACVQKIQGTSFANGMERCKRPEENELMPFDVKVLQIGNAAPPQCTSKADSLDDVVRNATWSMHKERQELMQGGASIGNAAPRQCGASKEASLDDVVRNATWSMHTEGQELMQGGGNGMRTFCEEWWTRQRPSNTELSCAQQVQLKQEGAGNISPSAPALAANNGGRRWAGPTLMDIEAALALTCSPTINYPSSVSSPAFPKSPAYLLAGSVCLKDILHQETTSILATSSSYSTCKEERPATHVEEEDAIWRRLQKRTQMEPKYTVKIRSEEDAINDGYRWRKYGQKSIKNSPHPRSYYRCSSGACGVKKQVERSQDDAGLLLVSYEGIHLHHRPYSATPTPTPTTRECP